MLQTLGMTTVSDAKIEGHYMPCSDTNDITNNAFFHKVIIFKSFNSVLKEDILCSKKVTENARCSSKVSEVHIGYLRKTGGYLILHSSYFTLHSSYFTLHSPYFTLCSSYFILYS